MWPVAAPVESLTVTVKQVRVLFEVENQDYQVPRLSVRTGLHATVHDWSRQVGVLSSTFTSTRYSLQSFMIITGRRMSEIVTLANK